MIFKKKLYSNFPPILKTLAFCIIVGPPIALLVLILLGTLVAIQNNTNFSFYSLTTIFFQSLFITIPMGYVTFGIQAACLGLLYVIIGWKWNRIPTLFSFFSGPIVLFATIVLPSLLRSLSFNYWFVLGAIFFKNSGFFTIFLPVSIMSSVCGFACNHFFVTRKP